MVLVALARDDDDALRASWQGRVLKAARGRMMFFITSMLAHSFDDDLPFLLNAVRPLCWDSARRSLRAPFLCSIGRINYGGMIEAKVVHRDGTTSHDVIFPSSRQFETDLRRLADAVKLDDAERIEFFAHARRWVGSDQRLDPTMDPSDPDARRIVH